MRGGRRCQQEEEHGQQDVSALVWRAQAGDLDAFARLAAAHQPALLRFCRRLMGDAPGAEDLAQETLLRAQASIGRLGEPYRFGPWLLGIAANLARKWWRVQARSPLSLDSLISAYPNVAWDESLYAVASPEQIGEEAEQTQLLMDAIASLPAALSRVVVLHYLDGLDYAEVAAALDVPVSTVKGRLFKSRARLRSELVAAGAGVPHVARQGVRRAQTKEEAKMDSTDGPDRPQKMTYGQIVGSLNRSTNNRKAGIDGTLRPGHRDPGAPGWPVATGWPMSPGPGGEGETRHIRIEVDRDALVEEVFAYVTAPGPAENRRRALRELASRRNMWLPRDLLNQMVLDGVTKRKDIEDLIDFAIAEHDLIAR